MLQKGIPVALGSALLFGAGTPLAKLLLNHVSPLLLAGFLYLGSGIGLTLYRFIIRAPSVKFEREEIAWFAAAILFAGVWLHLSERHEHLHEHTPLEHEHSHDEHHQHTHIKSEDTGLTHTHRHSHEPIKHSHSHFPDAHHQHNHDDLLK